MSAFRSPDLLVVRSQRRQDDRQRQASQCRKARLAESPSIGDSRWHWTDLKRATTTGVGAASPPMESHGTKKSGKFVGPPRAAQWHA
jgi:hypothetical protein